LRGIEDVLRYEGVLCPGFIDLCSGVGMTGGRSERVGTIDDTLTASDGFDPTSGETARAANAGVTSALICSAGNQVVGGVCSLVSTGGSEMATSVLRAEGPLMVSITPATWDADAGPSSRAGVLYELRGKLSAALAANDGSRLSRFAKGQLDGIIRTASFEDVDAALDIAAAFEIVPTIMHRDDAVEVASILENWAGVVVVGPYDFSNDVRTLSGAGALEDAGVELAFLGDGGSDSIRTTAHLAVRYGLDAAAARRGLTVNAARVSGATGTVGTLTVGARADLVVWNRDPLRMDARLLGVWVGGELVSDTGNDTGWTDDEHVPGRGK
jgi:imidazolonepropionase-like amidohydrolase